MNLNWGCYFTVGADILYTDAQDFDKQLKNMSRVASVSAGVGFHNIYFHLFTVEVLNLPKIK